MSNLEYRLKYRDPQTGEIKQLSGGGVDIPSLKQEILEAENPVGCLRFQTISTNPSEYLGFGEWELWGSGRVPVGVDTGDTDFNTIEKTGGEKEHTLTINEMPSHKPSINSWRNPTEITPQPVDGFGFTSNDRAFANIATDGDGTSYTANDFRGFNYVGGSQSHNNLQPYITCYIYKRIK